MNGAADLGGMMGFGPIDPEADEPIFHSDWERRVFAVTLAMGFTRSWNLDQTRFARESLPPAKYLNSSYYQIWLAGLEKLTLERGLVSAEELKSGEVGTDDTSVAHVLTAGNVTATLSRGGPMDRTPQSEARFKAGDRVMTRNIHPVGHTRLPRYLRGHCGTIDKIHGVHVFPDSNVAGKGEDPQWLYSVSFTACELWGDDRAAGDLVFADCWEPYLVAA